PATGCLQLVKAVAGQGAGAPDQQPGSAGHGPGRAGPGNGADCGYPADLRTTGAGHPVSDSRRTGPLPRIGHAPAPAAAAPGKGLWLPPAADPCARIVTGQGPAATAG